MSQQLASEAAKYYEDAEDKWEKIFYVGPLRGVRSNLRTTVLDQLKQECQFDALLCTGIALLWCPGSELLGADEELRQEGDIASNMKPFELDFQRGKYPKYLLVRKIIGIFSERRQ
jgi:hypothetical protein